MLPNTAHCKIAFGLILVTEKHWVPLFELDKKHLLVIQNSSTNCVTSRFTFEDLFIFLPVCSNVVDLLPLLFLNRVHYFCYS